eukprot:NODE_905_length_1242_cov_215.451802_g690_i0.p1 GENE.NODE_905_length_1242_cov_215.451802_g690_i0~~NODE_905_length_1242_cov_215.451802_g690_i0.p1  ORF type:complete len:219 (+),score=46.42 NODE_905_length_1242_cov_215.451802_g690_i0:67-723(+)
MMSETTATDTATATAPPPFSTTTGPKTKHHHFWHLLDRRHSYDHLPSNDNQQPTPTTASQAAASQEDLQQLWKHLDTRFDAIQRDVSALAAAMNQSEVLLSHQSVDTTSAATSHVKVASAPTNAFATPLNLSSAAVGVNTSLREEEEEKAGYTNASGGGGRRPNMKEDGGQDDWVHHPVGRQKETVDFAAKRGDSSCSLSSDIPDPVSISLPPSHSHQ